MHQIVSFSIVIWVYSIITFWCRFYFNLQWFYLHRISVWKITYNLDYIVCIKLWISTCIFIAMWEVSWSIKVALPVVLHERDWYVVAFAITLFFAPIHFDPTMSRKLLMHFIRVVVTASDNIPFYKLQHVINLFRKGTNISLITEV